MITLNEAKNKALEYEFYKGYEIIRESETEKNYRFAFGFDGEPIPGLDLIIVDKTTGELSTYNAFNEVLNNASEEIVFY